MALGRLLLHLGTLLALALQGAAWPLPREAEEARLLAGGPVLAIKEDRLGPQAPLLNATPPKPLPGKASGATSHPLPRPREAPPHPPLYLLYGRLQLEGG
ncbi:hypothetical protein [Thermus thermamylovorans]|uniref:Uncharacterized protein n=1 Tax=Thermus thermamylovorans TaxID=2509362 RepID=A0A4Q9B729_9DEIN|nr:hypothetical protein [Thermus thermamylovorans]TBH21537.1 hypothetical protein ETP66_02705 [Thermus thermamylovorans]